MSNLSKGIKITKYVNNNNNFSNFWWSNITPVKKILPRLHHILEKAYEIF